MEEVIKLASMGINLRSQALFLTVSIFPLLTLPLCLEPPPEFTLWPALGHSQSPKTLRMGTFRNQLLLGEQEVERCGIKRGGIYK